MSYTVVDEMYFDFIESSDEFIRSVHEDYFDDIVLNEVCLTEADDKDNIPEKPKKITFFKKVKYKLYQIFKKFIEFIRKIANKISEIWLNISKKINMIDAVARKFLTELNYSDLEQAKENGWGGINAWSDDAKKDVTFVSKPSSTNLVGLHHVIMNSNEVRMIRNNINLMEKEYEKSMKEDEQRGRNDQPSNAIGDGRSSQDTGYVPKVNNEEFNHLVNTHADLMQKLNTLVKDKMEELDKDHLTSSRRERVGKNIMDANLLSKAGEYWDIENDEWEVNGRKYPGMKVVRNKYYPSREEFDAVKDMACNSQKYTKLAQLEVLKYPKMLQKDVIDPLTRELEDLDRKDTPDAAAAAKIVKAKLDLANVELKVRSYIPRMMFSTAKVIIIMSVTSYVALCNSVRDYVPRLQKKKKSKK